MRLSLFADILKDIQCFCKQTGRETDIFSGVVTLPNNYASFWKKKVSTLKGRKLLPLAANYFLLEQTFFEKWVGVKNETGSYSCFLCQINAENLLRVSVQVQNSWLPCKCIYSAERLKRQMCQVTTKPRIRPVITKTCLFQYTENFSTKNWKFSDKILIFVTFLLKT